MEPESVPDNTQSKDKDRVKNVNQGEAYPTKTTGAYRNLLGMGTLKNFLTEHAMTENNVGNTHRSLFEIKDKAENFKREIKRYEKPPRTYSLEDFSMENVMTQKDIGAAYDILEEEAKINRQPKYREKFKVAEPLTTQLEYEEKKYDVKSSVNLAGSDGYPCGLQQEVKDYPGSK